VRQDRTGEELAVLLYTSGTSGRPKGAMLPVRALLANLDQVAQLRPVPVTAEDRVFLPLPLFHVFGLNSGLGLALYFGATLVLSERFDAAASLRQIQDEQVSVVVGAPLEFALWAAQPEFATAFAGVRLALSGSAPLPPELIGRYAEVGVRLFEGYGLTEAAPVVTLDLSPAEQGGWQQPKPGSVGRPLPEVEVRLVDSDGEPVEVGDLGLLEVRGQNLFLGYWPEGTDGPDPDGWFATGDLAVADDDGDYYLVGRRSDLVLVNGFNVYPAEVEAVLRRLPGVAEVAVLGEPDTGTSEAIVAYLVPEPGAVLDLEELLEQAGRSLARFKLPRRIVEVDRLPHTATGKVMKWRLRAAGVGSATGFRGTVG
jgi:long-chain acyl-CoA synthetase